MSTTLSPGTATTSAQRQGAVMSTAQRAIEIEALKLLMAHYERWGDTQQWDRFGSLFHDDAVTVNLADLDEKAQNKRKPNQGTFH